MKRLAFLLSFLLVLGSTVVAQGNREGTNSTTAASLRGVGSDPTGAACSPSTTGAVAVRIYNGGLYVCVSGVYAAISGSGGGTTINSTNGQLPYRVNSTTFGDSAFASNALNSTYLSVTSGASGSGVTVATAGGGTNENLIIAPKGTGKVAINTLTGNPALTITASGSTSTQGIIQAFIPSLSSGNYASYDFGRSGNNFESASYGFVYNTTTSNVRAYLGIVGDAAAFGGESLSVRQGGRVSIGDSGFTFPAQMTVVSRSTTLPAGRFQAASGTSGSQEMFGVYDGSGALTASFSADGSLRWGSSADTILTRDAANTLAQRNSTNAQTFRVYNTYTDASNYERGFIRYVSNALEIGHEGLGTGSATRTIKFKNNSITVTLDGVGNLIIPSTAGYYFTSRSGFTSSADGLLMLSNYYETDFDRLQFGGTSASFPALKRSGAGLQVKLADNSAFTTIEATDITANGWLWARGSDPSIYLGGSSDASIKRVAPKVIAIMDGNVSAGTLRAIPDSPTQLTADQNNYQAGTGRSLFYRLSSDASRTITGFNPAGGTNQDGELHYLINVGSNNIVLANESASSTAANRFTTNTGSDITLAANEMAMIVYDNTSARWRAAKL